jgi:hypothetical protein
MASPSPPNSSVAYLRRSVSPPRRLRFPASRMPRGTGGSDSRRPGRPISLVKTPWRAQTPLSKRRNVGMPMAQAHLAIFEASPTTLATDRKTPTYPTAMWVPTFRRFESQGMVRHAVLTTISTRRTTSPSSPPSPLRPPPDQPNPPEDQAPANPATQPAQVVTPKVATDGLSIPPWLDRSLSEQQRGTAWARERLGPPAISAGPDDDLADFEM